MKGFFKEVYGQPITFSAWWKFWLILCVHGGAVSLAHTVNLWVGFAAGVIVWLLVELLEDK